MSVLSALQKRNSHAKLIGPGPDREAIDEIVTAGLRAPDHGRLRPWHFVAVAGDRRAALGDVFATSLRTTNPNASDAELSKARYAPERAPLIIAGLLKPKEHPKVPRTEQVAAVASALYGMSIAAEALGFAAMWRTGNYAQDPLVISALGGDPGDEIVGFLYIGTRDGDSKILPELEPADYLSWF